MLCLNGAMSLNFKGTKAKLMVNSGHFKLVRTLLLSASLSAFMITPALAVVDIPGSADAGRTQESLPTPDFQNGVSPKINIPEIRVENAPDGAENIRFVLKDIVLEGVTAYSQDDLAPLYSNSIGTEISLTDVYAIAQSITRKYRSEGYLITQAVIPQQTIEDGIVTIQVVEGYIDQVFIQDDANSMASERMRGMAEQLKQSNPLTASDLERWLLLVNDMPGVTARSIISPSKTTIGGADITIIPTTDPYEFSLSVDNYGSRYLGPVQVSAAAQFNNLFNLADLLKAQFVKSIDDDDLIYGSVAYEMPINNYGTRLKLDISHSDTAPGYDLEIFEVEGYSTTMGIEASHPIIRSRTQNLFGSLRFDYRTLSSQNIVDAVDRSERIPAIRLGLDYNIFDTIWKPAVNEMSMTVSHGLDIFNATDKGANTLTRANGDPQYTKAEAEISRLQTLTNDLNVFVGVRGQLASGPLLSSEEFGIGGRTYGRGYDSSEIVGDHGVAAKIELQWNTPAPIEFVDKYQLFGFYDIGRVWNDDEVVANIQRASLASTGFGVRADVLKNVSGELMATFPLTRDVQTRGSEDPRFFFSLSSDF